MFKSKEEREAIATRKEAERRAREERQAKRAELLTQIQRERAELAQRRKKYGQALEQHRRKNSVKWEYLQLDDRNAEQLDLLGEWGWELVSVTPFSVTEGATNIWHMRYSFKRQLIEEPTELMVEMADILSKELNLTMREQELEDLK